MVGQPVIDVVIKAAVINRIGVGSIGDPAGRIVGYGTGIAADWMSFEPAIWWIAASGESTVQFIRRTVVKKLRPSSYTIFRHFLFTLHKCNNFC